MLDLCAVTANRFCCTQLLPAVYRQNLHHLPADSSIVMQILPKLTLGLHAGQATKSTNDGLHFGVTPSAVSAAF